MATGRSQVYRCEKCGNMIEVIHEAGGTLVCCDESMKLMEENTVDAAKEKHVPLVEKVSGGIKVKVGSVAHPMEEKHYIEWIQVTSNGKSYREFLKPGAEPEAFFPVEDGKEISVREFCNLHGVWKA